MEFDFTARMATFLFSVSLFFFALLFTLNQQKVLSASKSPHTKLRTRKRGKGGGGKKGFSNQISCKKNIYINLIFIFRISFDVPFISWAWMVWFTVAGLKHRAEQLQIEFVCSASAFFRFISHSTQKAQSHTHSRLCENIELLLFSMLSNVRWLFHEYVMQFCVRCKWYTEREKENFIVSFKIGLRHRCFSSSFFCLQLEAKKLFSQ